ncbi:FAD-binding oxidoreductase [Thermomonospora amylolytica]|uniref:FAD-binding oxidoreductase n=1 Tax=Thermomonospora amylolytica TaxID=1411117 RepID=UPI001F364E87|nr:FAD-dependent oxidoreductase [Thermomonospora amylolytica]
MGAGSTIMWDGVAFPGSRAYEEATQVFNLAAPLEPAAAATVRTVDQIRDVLRHAEREGLQVAVHTTGHASATARPMRGTVLIRTRLDGGVELDTERRIARIPAGTRWGAVVRATAPSGLAAPHGSAATVGVVGYLLRGGLSFYSRRVGLAVNSVRAIELVTADGSVLRTDADNDPELFWALRGGGGGFGVVTAVEIELFPAARVVTGATFWPAVHAPRLVPIWRRWTRDAPWDASTSLRILNLPDLPEVPPVLRGGPVLCIDGVILCPAEEDLPAARGHAEDLLGPLRAAAEPMLDTWQVTVPAAVLETHMDPADPVPIAGDHMLLDEIGDEGVAEFLRTAADGSDSPLILAGLRQLGGACSIPSPGGGALDHLAGRYVYSAAGAPADEAHEAAIARRCAAIRAAMSPWDTGRTAPTFVENRRQPQRHLTPDQVRAVHRIRARVDPDGRFRNDVLPNC